MKKLMLTLCVCVSAAMVSCKETDKKTNADTDTELHQGHAANEADMAMNAKYQCPMDCEDGKTYDHPGACPVCAMDLKKVEKEGEHTHADGTTHKDHDDEGSHDDDH
jgi:hypothetical protein